METLKAALELIKQYDEALLVLLTTGILLSGIGSLFVAGYLVRENRILRKAGTEPDVVAYLLPDRRHVTIVRLHIKNIGRGSATEIAFEVGGDHDSFREAKLELPLVRGRTPISVLPPDDEISLFFGMGHQLLADPKLGPVPLEIAYKNAAGKEYRKSVTLDISQFEGFHWVGKRAEDEVADTLKKMEGHLRHLASGFKKLHVVSASPDQWREKQEREVAEMRAAREKQKQQEEGDPGGSG